MTIKIKPPVIFTEQHIVILHIDEWNSSLMNFVYIVLCHCVYVLENHSKCKAWLVMLVLLRGVVQEK